MIKKTVWIFFLFIVYIFNNEKPYYNSLKNIYELFNQRLPIILCVIMYFFNILNT